MRHLKSQGGTRQARLSPVRNGWRSTNTSRLWVVVKIKYSLQFDAMSIYSLKARFVYSLQRDS
jgi:hypothetical protein